MAILATAVWEVRPTNGSNLNGGGYDSGIAGAGTDYSQQDAAEASFTDLVTADGTTVTVTSVLGGFTAAMVGNALHIESGTNWETGFYFIVTYVSSNEVTVDRSPTSAAGALGVGKVGGATKSCSGQTTTTLAASLISGNKVWVKNETWNESATGFAAASSGNPIVIEGYNSTRGDAPTGANRPTNDRASAGAPFVFAGTYYVIKNLRATRSTGVGFNANATGVNFINCRAYNNTSQGFNATSNSTFINCEADTNTTIGFACAANDRILGCYSHDNTTRGYYAPAQSIMFTFCIADANATNGFEGTTEACLINCTSDGNTLDGLKGTTPINNPIVFNCIFSNNGDHGADYTDGDNIVANYNCFFGNTTAARNNFPTGANDVSTDPSFADRAAGNFAVSSNMQALGFPGLFPGGLSTGYLDIGAVQRIEPGVVSGGVTGAYFIGLRRGKVMAKAGR